MSPFAAHFLFPSHGLEKGKPPDSLSRCHLSREPGCYSPWDTGLRGAARQDRRGEEAIRKGGGAPRAQQFAASPKVWPVTLIFTESTSHAGHCVVFTGRFSRSKGTKRRNRT